LFIQTDIFPRLKQQIKTFVDFYDVFCYCTSFKCDLCPKALGKAKQAIKIALININHPINQLIIY